MFNLDNFDLDFEDDFTSTILNKCNKSQAQNNNAFQNKFILNQGSHVLDEGSNRQVPEKLKNESFQAKKHQNESLADFEFSSPQNTHLKTNRLKRPCEEEEKRKKKKLTHEKLLQRKFPGPAGLLPDKPLQEDDLRIIENKSSRNEINERDRDETVLFSQSSGSVFSESAYQKLVSDFELNEPQNPLTKYTVEWVKKSAINKSLNGRKIPFLALTLHCINNSTPDPILILRDTSGEISGTLHREVWAEMGDKFRSGIAIALRQVGVLITGIIRRKIYLNITMNNILSIYSRTENDNEVETYSVNKSSKVDLLKSAERWQTQLACQSPRQSLENPLTLFSTVTSPRPNQKPTHTNEQIKNAMNKSKVNETERDLANLGVVFNENDFNEDMKTPQNEVSFDLLDDGETSKEKGNSTKFQNTALSQADSLIMEEVLSGINLDDFEL